MGRKIPGRKHRGVRDPEKQQQQRIETLKEKINAPPTNPEDQPVPQSLKRFMELKEQGKNPKLKREKPKLYPKPSKFYEKPTPKFERQQGESDKAFLNRVNRICLQVTKEAAFEDKYGVNVKRNRETGEVEGLVKRPKDELQVLVKKAKKEMNDTKIKKKKKKTENAEPKLTKSQKWQLKKKLKKQKKAGEIADTPDFNKLKDSVKFGEIVHEPPTLVKPKRVQSTNGVAPRPGIKELLLKSLINKKQDKTTHKVIDKKGKRKDLPNALRRQLDQQQQEIIEAYKSLKRKKSTS